MRGADLNTFKFDYDLTWAGFFLNGHGKIYGRYGGREEGRADAYLTLAGLKYAMRQALAAYRRAPDARPEPAMPVSRVELYPASRKLKADACIHCHQVYDFSRADLRAKKQWRQEMVWVYPPPKNVGMRLDPNQGDKLTAVSPGSAAAKAGLRAGDVLRSVNGLPTASFADVQYALHQAPAAGVMPVTWVRNKQQRTGNMTLAKGWRKSDISWRGSMWALEPAASVYGRDLFEEEKRKLGLGPKRLAFAMGKFVPQPARRSGIRADDIILGIDGRKLEMTMLQFNVFIRLNFQPGDRIVYNVIRNGKRLEIPMTLAARDSF